MDKTESLKAELRAMENRPFKCPPVCTAFWNDAAWDRWMGVDPGYNAKMRSLRDQIAAMEQ